MTMLDMIEMLAKGEYEACQVKPVNSRTKKQWSNQFWLRIKSEELQVIKEYKLAEIKNDKQSLFGVVTWLLIKCSGIVAIEDELAEVYDLL